MEITIIKGSLDNINDCEEALVKSELGVRYFSQEGKARNALKEGFARGEIYVAVDKDHNCKGLIWIILNGMFHSYPYVHIIAVKKGDRNQGIGKKLLEFSENFCRNENCLKLFLVVADFNPEAKKLYESIGYIEVGLIPDLYREGINEYLMMKKI